MEERKGLAFWNGDVPKSGGVQEESVHWRRPGMHYQTGSLVYDPEQDSYDTLPPYMCK